MSEDSDDELNIKISEKRKNLPIALKNSPEKSFNTNLNHTISVSSRGQESKGFIEK